MKLKKGDTVALVAPAGIIKDTGIIDQAEHLLAEWGLKTVVGRHVSNRKEVFAGTDTERLQDLQEALDSPEVKLIWALRGGYGTNRIIDRLDFAKFKQNPKLIAGYSDITILHNKLHNLGYPSIHSIMPVNLNEKISEKILELTRKAFFGEPLHFSFDFSMENTNFQSVEAVVIGGNLAILYSLLGTNLDVDTTGKILLIEDIGEKLYQIDRMIISMKKAGKFEGIKALLVGQFTDIPQETPGFDRDYRQLIKEHLAEYDFPVIFDVPVGHITENYPLILGKNLLIKNKENTIELIQNS